MNLIQTVENKAREQGYDEQLFYITIAKQYGISQAYRRYETCKGCTHGYETFVWKHNEDGKRDLIKQYGVIDALQLARKLAEIEDIEAFLQEED